MSDTLMYDLPDTVKLGLTEAQAYAVAWDTFHRIQKEAPHAMVYYSGCYNVCMDHCIDSAFAAGRLYKNIIAAIWLDSF